MPPEARMVGALFFTSLAAWSVLVQVHVLPLLASMSRRDALLVVLVPQMFRHVGALALLPGIGDVPGEWALPLAWGDAATALLAIAAMAALHRRLRWAEGAAWAATVVGLLDLLRNAYGAVAMQLAPRLGVIAYVVTLAVPGMLVAHLLALRILLTRRAAGD